MKKLFNFALFLIFSACLIAGFVFGLSAGRADVGKSSGNEKTIPGLPTPTIPNGSANGQRNILLIGVDRLESPTPRLESVWLVLYIPPSPQLTLIPLYPGGLDGGPGSDEFLVSSFKLDENRDLDPTFIWALQSNELWWNNYIIADENGLSKLIDLADGIEINGTHVDGQTLINNLPQAWVDAKKAISTQALMLSSLCGKNFENYAKIDMPGLLSLLESHLHTNYTPDELASEIRLLQGVNERRSCKFPTFENNSFPTNP